MQQVLLVDDEEELRATLSYFLISQGYKVTTAADGVTALKLVQQKKPDIVILDLMLPKMGC